MANMTVSGTGPGIRIRQEKQNRQEQEGMTKGKKMSGQREQVSRTIKLNIVLENVYIFKSRNAVVNILLFLYLDLFKYSCNPALIHCTVT